MLKGLKKEFHQLRVQEKLTKNEIKDIIKVIKSLENGGISFKGTTWKIASQEERFLHFLRQLMTSVSPLMKSVLTHLAKNVLLPFRLSVGISAADAVIQKKNYGSGCPSDLSSRTTALIISNVKMKI